MLSTLRFMAATSAGDLAEIQVPYVDRTSIQEAVTKINLTPVSL
jgi:hypothetical protein